MLKNCVNQFKFGQFRKKCGANRNLLIMKWTAKQENNRALERTVFFYCICSGPSPGVYNNSKKKCCEVRYYSLDGNDVCGFVMLALDW